MFNMHSLTKLLSWIIHICLTSSMFKGNKYKFDVAGYRHEH
jgi:hypothetical protein